MDLLSLHDFLLYCLIFVLVMGTGFLLVLIPYALDRLKPKR